MISRKLKKAPTRSRYSASRFEPPSRRSHGWLVASGSGRDQERRRPHVSTQHLREILERQIAKTEALQRATGRIIPWLFHREGNQIKSFRRSWISACIQAGFGKRITDKQGKLIKAVADRIPHDFRRTAVRNLERAGVPRSAAMKMVGHKTRASYSRYTIADETMLRDAGDTLGRLHAIDQNEAQRKAATRE